MIKLSDKLKKSIAETSGLTFLADNLEKNLSDSDGKTLKDTLYFYSTTTSQIEQITDEIFPKVEKENPSLVVEKEFIELEITSNCKNQKIYVNGVISDSNMIKVEKWSRVNIRIECIGFNTLIDSFVISDNMHKHYNLTEKTSYLELTPEKIWIDKLPVEVLVNSNTEWKIEQ